MPENTSADGLRRAPRVRQILAAASFTPRQKLQLLVLNALPLGLLVIACMVFFFFPAAFVARTASALAVLLLLPPLCARAFLRHPLTMGEHPVPSPDFFRWWAAWQLQGLFNRLPMIEEMLRLVPGLYSIWLRLWGARIGRLTLWSPGVRILDRQMLVVGDDVVIGIDVRVVGHFGGLDADGQSTLKVGPVTICDRCSIGGSALLGPGFVLDADQATETLFLGTPFTRWSEGSRIKKSDVPSTEL